MRTFENRRKIAHSGQSTCAAMRRSSRRPPLACGHTMKQPGRRAPPLPAPSLFCSPGNPNRHFRPRAGFSTLKGLRRPPGLQDTRHEDQQAPARVRSPRFFCPRGMRDRCGLSRACSAPAGSCMRGAPFAHPAHLVEAAAGLQLCANQHPDVTQAAEADPAGPLQQRRGAQKCRVCAFQPPRLGRSQPVPPARRAR